MRNKYAKVSDPNSFCSCCGNKKHILYSPSIDLNGDITLVESASEDIQEKIDSFLPTTDISFIISRLEAGDESVLNQNPGMYGDFTELPKTYAEALQMVIDAEHKFNALPLDVRNSFDNNYNKWFATAGSESWFEKMKPVISPVSETAVSDQETKE